MELLVKLVERVQGNRGGVLDTGCSRALVHWKVVPKEEFLEERATVVCCAHGDTVSYPLAKVRMEVEGNQQKLRLLCPIEVEAALSDCLPVEYCWVQMFPNCPSY